MSWQGSKLGLAAGGAVILIVNVALIAAAAWNRQGEPEAELALTERELAIVADEQEEHGGLMLSLRLATRTPDVVRRASRLRRHELVPLEHPWLDRDKLRDLGFDVDLDPADPEADAYYLAARMRRAYLALEFEGPAWTDWLALEERRVEQLRRSAGDGAADSEALADAEALLALDRAMRSRLFPVDAAADAESLRERYPDRRRYAVVEGLVRPRLLRTEDGAPFLSGTIQGPLPEHITVPLRLRHLFEPALPVETRRQREAREREEARDGWPAPVPPRYRAVVAFGRRHEPWLVGVEALDR